MSGSQAFAGKVAIVTGAGTGLGKAHARYLAQRGASVVVNDVGVSKTGSGGTDSVAHSVADEFRAAGFDAVADCHSVVDGAAVAHTALQTYGRIDIVISNAGIIRDKSFHNMSVADWDAVYQVHVQGAFALCRAVWAAMREQAYGRIIFTTSASGIYGNFGQANYSMAKAGLIGLCKTLALEGQGHNIHVNAIAPVAASRMAEGIFPDAIWEHVKPEYISPYVAWLCHSDCRESGALFEAGAGYIGKLRWQRTRGYAHDVRAPLEVEEVAELWPQVIDFDGADSYSTVEQAINSFVRPQIDRYEK